MRILDIVNDISNGCYWVRNKQPFDELRKRGHVIKDTFADKSVNFTEWDAFHCSRMYKGNYTELITLLKEHGLKLIYDIDDGADFIEPFNVYYQPVKELLPSYYYMLNEADLVTTTTPELAEHLKTHGAKNVEVIPNCIDPKWWRPRAGGNKKIRIGFSGSNTHIWDIQIVMCALVELKKKGIDFEFVIWGFGNYPDTLKEWIKKNRDVLQDRKDHPFIQALDKFEQLAQLLEDRIVWKTAVPIEMFAERTSELNFDIGVCPLSDNKFNSMKSCIKFYEYASVGTLTLASNVLPFSKELHEDFLIENSVEEWVNVLEDLIACWTDNPEVFAEETQKQIDWVKKNRTLQDWTDKREAAYLALMPKEQQLKLEDIEDAELIKS